MIRANLSLICMMLFSAALTAQEPKLEFPTPSPLSTLKQRIGVTDVEIVYSRPSMKNRAVFGSLVPYGEVWRTGANMSTDISFSSAVKFNGADVPAGKYSLFSIPGAQEWTIILNKTPAQPGASKYEQATDLVRVKVRPVQVAQAVETFTIDINELRDGSATLNLLWDKTRVPVKIEIDTVAMLQPKIAAAMAAPSGEKPSFQAVSFYLDNGLDINKAREWIDAAVKKEEAFYLVHLQAKVLAKQGQKQAAIKAAQRSSELAVKAQGPTSGYVKMNQDLISSLR